MLATRLLAAKCKKKKNKYFQFLFADSEKLLTFATPIRTAGSGVFQPAAITGASRRQQLLKLKKRFGQKKKNAELCQPQQREHKRAAGSFAA